MTSWIKVPLKKADETERPYFFQVNTSGDDFCVQFNTYLYAYMYAKSNNKKLVIYDKSNSISANYELLREPFRLPSGVDYSDSILPSAISLSGRQSRLVNFLSSVVPDDLSEAAANLFQWSDNMLLEIETLIKSMSIPEEFDIGIHIPQGQVSIYIETVKTQVKRAGLVNPVIFVVAPALLIQEFKRRADPSWRVTFLPDTRQPASRVASRVRLAMYTQFLAELYILQSAPVLISSLADSKGRFLYLTSKGTFVSTDTQTFRFF